jgi:hypothetical protein
MRATELDSFSPRSDADESRVLMAMHPPPAEPGVVSRLADDRVSNESRRHDSTVAVLHPTGGVHRETYLPADRDYQSTLELRTGL